jgi:hypothetical protein
MECFLVDDALLRVGVLERVGAGTGHVGGCAAVLCGLEGQIEEVERQKRPFRNSSVKLASTALSPGALLKSARAIMRKYKGLIFILSDEFLAGSDPAFFQPGCR